MSTLVKQLCEQQTTIDATLVREHKDAGEKPTRTMVQNITDSVLSALARVTLAIDALDELKDKEKLARSLVELIEEKSNTCVKIIVFSREDHEIEEHFARFQHLQLDQGANNDDLKKYIEHCFPDDTKHPDNPKVREECFGKADGMFLWVKLMQENLKGPMSEAQRLRRISAQPPGLDPLYDHLLQRIWRQGRDTWETAVLVLTWVTRALTPLTASQMLEAVVDYTSVSTVDEASRFKLPSANDLVAICANLVLIDRDGYFRLCHESVRDYLDAVGDNAIEPLAKYREHTLSAQAHLAETCVNYLLLEDFQYGPSSFLRLVIMERQHTFLSDAAKFWGSHAFGQDKPQLRNRILELVSSLPCRELTLQTVHVEVDEDRWNCGKPSNPLHVIALFGLVWIAESVPNADDLVAQTNEIGATPLLYAMLGNHQTMGLWLIERLRGPPRLLLRQSREVSVIHCAAGLGWADVLKELLRGDSRLVHSREEPSGPTPLAAACRTAEGQSLAALETASILIQHNADVNDPQGPSDSALMWATWLRHTALMDLLLHHGAEPDPRDSFGLTPLHYAAQYESPSVAEALLRCGADPKATTLNALGYTPLHLAARSQSVKVIQVLYRVYSNLDMKSISGSTALHIAAMHNSAEATKTLLRLGASKDEVDVDGQTALFVAAQAGADEVLTILVDAGCDMSLRTSDGHTVIHAAARSGKSSTLRNIMRNQTSHKWRPLLSMTNNRGETPTHAAVRGGNVKALRKLLRSGALATSGDEAGFTPLHYAASFGHDSMLYDLLECTKDANARNMDGNTPLHSAAVAGNVSLIKQYFETCSALGQSVDFDAKNSSGQTPFMLALVSSHRDAAQVFLDKQPASVPDTTGSYPIHYAASYGFGPMVEAMLSLEGASVKDSNGRTALSWAAICGHSSTLALLATSQPELLDVPDETGATPLMLALLGKHLECAHFLLDRNAACDKADESGDTALHIAAEVGDVPMVQRLLRNGCHFDVLNRWNDTPFHRAIRANKVEVIHAFVAAGLTTFDEINRWGDSGVLIASRNGDLDMLRLLVEYGAQLTVRNHLGRTAAHDAAACGSVDVQDFLAQRRAAMTLPDTEGYTPLLLAASTGCPEAVRHLLRVSKPDVNASNNWDRETPLLAAAKRGYPLTVRCLLGAGADPHRRDAFGRNALEYAARHKEALREFEAAHVTATQASIEDQRDTLCSTISRCCNALISFPSEMSATEEWSRLCAVDTLSVALQFAEDHDAALVCFREMLFPSKMTLMCINFSCDVCGAKQFPGPKYVCKNCCSPMVILCTACHEDYTAAKQSPPKALTESTQLERLIQPVRVASEALTVFETIAGILYFDLSKQWFSSIRDRYDAWEKRYNSSSRFQELYRPGFEYLRLLTEAETLVIRMRSTSVVGTYSEDLKSLAVLEKEYRAHQKKDPPHKEIVDLLCKGHEFLRVSVNGDKGTTDASSDHPKATESFAKATILKYNTKRGVQNSVLDGRASTLSESFDRKDPSLSTEPAYNADNIGPITRESSRLAYSTTGAGATFAESLEIHKGSKFIHFPPEGSSTLATHDYLAVAQSSRLRRSSTLPLPTAVLEVLRPERSSTGRVVTGRQLDSVSDSRVLEMPTASAAQTKDTGVIATPITTQNFSLTARGKTYPDHTQDVTGVNRTFSETMPMLDVALSHEPDSIEGLPISEEPDGSTSVQNTQPKDLVISSLNHWLNSLPHPTEAYLRFLRIAHVMPHVNG